MKGVVVSALVAAFSHRSRPSLAPSRATRRRSPRWPRSTTSSGLDAYKAGKYPEAIKELKKAYLLKRLPALLLNIGATYRKMNDLDNAAYYYKKYLAEAPDAKDRGEVEKTLAEIEQEKPGAGASASAAGGAEATPSEVAGAARDGRVEAHAGRRGAAGAAARRARADAGHEGRQGLRLLSRRGAGRLQPGADAPSRRREGRPHPADAMAGKSVQYYVEGKDDKGNVVKSFGSAVGSRTSCASTSQRGAASGARRAARRRSDKGTLGAGRARRRGGADHRRDCGEAEEASRRLVVVGAGDAHGALRRGVLGRARPSRSSASPASPSAATFCIRPRATRTC